MFKFLKNLIWPDTTNEETGPTPQFVWVPYRIVSGKLKTVHHMHGYELFFNHMEELWTALNKTKYSIGDYFKSNIKVYAIPVTRLPADDQYADRAQFYIDFMEEQQEAFQKQYMNSNVWYIFCKTREHGWCFSHQNNNGDGFTTWQEASDTYELTVEKTQALDIKYMKFTRKDVEMTNAFFNNVADQIAKEKDNELMCMHVCDGSCGG